MKKASRTAIILILLAAIVMALFFWLRPHSNAQPDKTPEATLVKTQNPQVLKTTKSITVSGSITAKRRTYLTPKDPGYIKKILFHEGEQVKHGQPLIILDSEKEKSQLTADKTDLTVKKNQYLADQKLFKKGYVSKTKMDTDHAEYAHQQSVVVSDETQLDNMTLKAPFTGTIGAKQVSLGDYVSSAQKLLSLVDRDHLLAVYSLPEKYAPLLEKGQTVTVTSQLNTNESLSGKIEYIAPDIDPDSRTIEVHAAINDTHHQLIPGQNVTVKQQLSKPLAELFVPAQSVIQSLKGAHVFIIQNGQAKKVSVKVGQRQNGLVAITQGLKKNDQIITAGAHKVKNKQKVKVK